MLWKRFSSFFLLGLLSNNLNVLASPFQQASSPGQTQVETVNDKPLSLPLDYVIGPGDILSIRVFQQPDLSGDVRVSTQGYIRLLFVNELIKAAGHTEWELADIIQEKLGAILRDPKVSVQVKEARQEVAYILGAVRNPRSVPVYSESRLLNMLAEAGGLSERAGAVAYILRGSVWSAENQGDQTSSQEVRLSSVIETVDIAKMFQGQVELNKRIYPGDVVSIPEAGKVFVGGSVNKPDAFDLRGELSLTQAITLAGGTKPEAKKSKVTIIRHEPGKPQLTELTVNLGEVEKSPSQDISLQAGDVVFVPSSTMKNLGLALLNSLAIQAALLPLYIIRR
ncbi:MAG: polysaccharide biosynthesis/export family protein [Acidobacteria bacterium]|nr:polysaccharide biosynthesis/export family protein [Acidobacteriota bacterium]